MDMKTMINTWVVGQNPEEVIDWEQNVWTPQMPSRKQKALWKALETTKLINELSNWWKKTLHELFLHGMVPQLYYLLDDATKLRGFGGGIKDKRAQENFWLFASNLIKHLAVTALVWWIPLPGTIEIAWFILYSNPKLRKHLELKFQMREDMPSEAVLNKLSCLACDISKVLGSMA